MKVWKVILILILLLIHVPITEGKMYKYRRLSFQELEKHLVIGQEIEIFDYSTNSRKFYRVNYIKKHHYIELIEKGTFYKFYITSITPEVESFLINIEGEYFF